MKRRALLLICISCMAIQSIHAQRTITESPRMTMRHSESANAEQDCALAIARHDFRFVGVAGARSTFQVCRITRLATGKRTQ
jgi:hypothetical protein